MARRHYRPIRDPGDDAWAQLHALIEARLPGLARAVVAALRALGADLDLAAVADALRVGDVDAVLRLVPFDALTAALHATEPTLQALRTAALTLTVARAAPHQVGVDWTLLSEAALAIARDEAAARVTEVTDATRAAIRALIAQGVQAGTNPRSVARQIATEVGLTTRQAAAVETYRAALSAAGVPAGRIETLVARRAAQLLRQRARTIAETEAATAANAGQRAAWAALVQRGLLDPDRLEREWLAILAGACPTCAALDGSRAPLGGTYPGGEPGPPEHPRCRCTERLVTRRPTPAHAAPSAPLRRARARM